MRILKHQSRFLACLVIVTFTLSSISAQKKEAVLKTFLDLATEEIPKQTMPQPVKQDKPSCDGIWEVLQNVTEEIPDNPKPQFVSSKLYTKDKLKIQLGYFKEKRNVNKMINKIKAKYDWPVYVKTENKNGTDYYRVLIVDISSHGTANAIMGQLNHDGLKAILK